MILGRFFIKGFLLLALEAAVSCSNNNVQNKSNAEFERKFSSDVSKINAARLPPAPLAQPDEAPLPKFQSQNAANKFASPNELLGVSGAAQYSSANVDTAKFSLKQIEDFSPDAQSLAAAKAAGQNKLPDDMFDLTYNLGLSPPFVASGLEFDMIKIPDRDHYGVASTLNKKRYLLAGNQVLQKNIDEIIKSQSAEEIELSEILIKEQKQLKKQQKLAKIFGEDSAAPKKDVDIQKAENAPTLDDTLQKAIALQVIKQNIAQNGGASNQNNAAATPANAAPANAAAQPK